MGAMKSMMMELGEKGMIHVTCDEIARWESATGTKVQTNTVILEQTATSSEGDCFQVLCITADEARRLADHPALTIEDMEEIAWRMLVGGID